jgi:hypothetical protein
LSSPSPRGVAQVAQVDEAVARMVEAGLLHPTHLTEVSRN